MELEAIADKAAHDIDRMCVKVQKTTYNGRPAVNVNFYVRDAKEIIAKAIKEARPTPIERVASIGRWLKGWGEVFYGAIREWRDNR